MKNPAKESNGLAPSKSRFSLGRLIDDFVVLATGQFLSKALGFLAFAWLARQLTLEDYGAVETAVGMVAIGSIALELGTGAAGVRRIAQRETGPADILGAVISVRLAIAVIVTPALALLYIELTKSETSDALFWLYAASLFAVPLNHSWFFQSQEKMFVAGFGSTLKMAVFLAAVILFAPQRNGVANAAYAEIVAVSAMALWYSLFAVRWLRQLRLRRSLAAGLEMFRESAYLGVSTLVNALAQYLPLLIVAAIANDRETAMFGASQRLVLSLGTFSYVYYFNLYPLIARRLVDDPAGLDALLAASSRVATWVGVAVSALLCALAPTVMRVVFGGEFEAAGPEFAVLVWVGALMLGLGNAKWLLTAGKRQGSLLAAHIATASVVVLSCFALTPKLGGLGAAIAMNLGFLAQWIVAHWQTRGMAARPRIVDSLPAIGAAAAVIAMLTIMKPDQFVGAAAALAIVGVGVALDRKFGPSLKTLARAKSSA